MLRSAPTIRSTEGNKCSLFTHREALSPSPFRLCGNLVSEYTDDVALVASGCTVYAVDVGSVQSLNGRGMAPTPAIFGKEEFFSVSSRIVNICFLDSSLGVQTLEAFHVVENRTLVRSLPLPSTSLGELGIPTVSLVQRAWLNVGCPEGTEPVVVVSTQKKIDIFVDGVLFTSCRLPALSLPALPVPWLHGFLVVANSARVSLYQVISFAAPPSVKAPYPFVLQARCASTVPGARAKALGLHQEAKEVLLSLENRNLVTFKISASAVAPGRTWPRATKYGQRFALSLPQAPTCVLALGHANDALVGDLVGGVGGDRLDYGFRSDSPWSGAAVLRDTLVGTTVKGTLYVVRSVSLMKEVTAQLGGEGQARAIEN